MVTWLPVLEFRKRPAGKPLVDHVNGAVPLETVQVWVKYETDPGPVVGLQERDSDPELPAPTVNCSELLPATDTLTVPAVVKYWAGMVAINSPELTNWVPKLALPN